VTGSIQSRNCSTAARSSLYRRNALFSYSPLINLKGKITQHSTHNLKRKIKRKKKFRFGKISLEGEMMRTRVHLHITAAVTHSSSIPLIFVSSYYLYTHTHTRDTLSSRLGSLRSIRFDYSMFKHRRRKRKKK
jgi:hypothetical protein